MGMEYRQTCEGEVATGAETGAVSDRANQLAEWEPNVNFTKEEPISADDLREGMRHFAQGVTIITTCKGEEVAGLTATAVSSVTAEPPRLIAFVNKESGAHRMILDSGVLCVNILAGAQEEIARVFAGMDKTLRGAERFQSGKWTTLKTGAPVLHGALTSFDCRVIKVIDESSHNAFLCEVLATKRGQSRQALVYHQGQFCRC